MKARKISASRDAGRWRAPLAGGVTRMDILRRRQEIVRAVRDYFHEQGFIEAEAPLLVRGTTPDATIGSFAVDGRYLVTSTEYQIKRMFAGGFEKIFTLTKNFRTGDCDRTHNPEFTMLEWARRGVTLDEIDADIEQVVWRAHKALGGGHDLRYGGREIALAPPWPKRTVAEIIAQLGGVAIDDFEAPALCRAIDGAGIKVRPQDREDRVFLITLLLDAAQKTLDFDKPVFLRDWPSFLTSSAREKSEGLVDRSELFIAGVELSDGFPFLTDHARQQENFARQQARRPAEGQQEIMLDEFYLEALRDGLPEGAGMAMGFDRLVMLLTGQNDIRNVLAFAWDEV